MSQIIIRDGHVHTPFCPHGSKDPLEAYVQQAIKLGREEITFTEHFPLPKGILVEEVTRECALLEEEVQPYLKAVDKLKRSYRGKIKIDKGFEVDYIEGCEEEIKERLNHHGEDIEDAILSVHFVKCQDEYLAVDSLEDMSSLIDKLGSIEAVYDLYFMTLLKSIKADLGPYKPKRLGHPSLIRTFNRKYPIDYNDKGLFKRIVSAMAERGYEVDFNVSGLRKPDCMETYPCGRFLNLIKEQGIKCIGGSDSHQVSHLSLLSDFRDTE